MTMSSVASALRVVDLVLALVLVLVMIVIVIVIVVIAIVIFMKVESAQQQSGIFEVR
jgi:hypothetical protein